MVSSTLNHKRTLNNTEHHENNLVSVFEKIDPVVKKILRYRFITPVITCYYMTKLLLRDYVEYLYFQKAIYHSTEPFEMN